MNRPQTVFYLVSDDEAFPRVRDIGRQPVPAAGLLFSHLALIDQYEEPRETQEAYIHIKRIDERPGSDLKNCKFLTRSVGELILPLLMSHRRKAPLIGVLATRLVWDPAHPTDFALVDVACHRTP
jgi:hypothetical protein